MGQWSTQWIKCAHTKSTNLPRSLGTHWLTLFKVYLKWVHISVGVFIFYKIISRAFCIFNWEKKKMVQFLRNQKCWGYQEGSEHWLLIFRGPEFDSQNSQGGLQSSVTLFLGVLMPLSGLLRAPAYMWYTDIHVGKTPTSIKKLKI